MARQPLTAEEIAERENDPTPFMRKMYRHPWRSGLGSGIYLAVLVISIGGHWAAALAVGIAMVLWTGLVWRAGGPGQRWRRYMLRRFPKKPSKA